MKTKGSIKWLLIAAMITFIVIVPAAAADAEPAVKNDVNASSPGKMEALTSVHDPYTPETDAGHVLTIRNAFSYDSKYVVYDTRRTAGSVVSPRIEIVDVDTGEVRVLYNVEEVGRGEKFVGIVTFHPSEYRVIFARGPEYDEGPGNASFYGYYRSRRLGTIVDFSKPGKPVTTISEARDETYPYTVGALRGGSHVHLYNPTGKMVSHTYDDNVLINNAGSADTIAYEINRRTICINEFVEGGVTVNASSTTGGFSKNHRDISGTAFSAVVAEISYNKEDPDSIIQASSEAFIGTNGYDKADGTHQNIALVFQGNLLTGGSELYVVDVPDNWKSQTKDSKGDPVTGTPTTRMNMPAGTVQRRLTFTDGKKGIGCCRYTSADGQWIYFKMNDEKGVSQMHRIKTTSTKDKQTIEQLTDIPTGVSSDYSMTSDGKYIYFRSGKLLCVASVEKREYKVLWDMTGLMNAQLKELEAEFPKDKVVMENNGDCIVSPDGKKVILQTSWYKYKTSTDTGIGSQIYIYRYNTGMDAEALFNGKASTGSFTDVGADYSWAAPSIEAMVKAGVISGVGGNRFAPALNIRRGDFAVMLTRAFQLKSDTLKSFDDVPASAYYAGDIGIAAQLGIISGSGGKFRPQDGITRQDAALLVQKTIEHLGYTMDPGSDETLSAFTDKGEITDYAKPALTSLVSEGLLSGSGGKINPKKLMTRAEVAVFLCNAMNKYPAK